MTAKPAAKPAKRSQSNGPANAISPARLEAFAILLEVERKHGHSDDLLRSPRVSALTAQDRNLCTTLVMDTLRWQIRLDALIRPLLTKPNARLDPEIRIALRLGALQLLFLDRIPAHAAVSESVALAKSAGHKFAAGMVNAVLRKLAAQPKPSLEPAQNLTSTQLAEATAHPAWLVERWAANYGLETAHAICIHGQHQPELTIRLNPNASPSVETELAGQGIVMDPGALLTSARRVVSGDVTATPAFQSGQIRIQDEGSQLIAELTGKGHIILDACAAPGGKTLVIAERNPDAEITACEIHPARYAALADRLAQSTFGASVRVIQADVVQLPVETGNYDLILADVPCSGTGTLGRNPEIRHRLSHSDLTHSDLTRHHSTQCGILSAALRFCTGSVRGRNPRVLYSTCSIEPEENSEVIAEVLAGSPDWQQIPLTSSIGELLEEGRLTRSGAESLLNCIAEDGSLTLLPGKLGSHPATDGFFIAMLEKRN